MADYLYTRVTEVNTGGNCMDFTLETGNEKGIKYSIPFVLHEMIPGSMIDFYHGCVTDGREKTINHDRYVQAEFRALRGHLVATIKGRKLKLLEQALKADDERRAGDAANERTSMGL